MVVHNLEIIDCIYLPGRNLNHLNKYYEEHTLCFRIFNDLCFINELRISWRYFQGWFLGRDIGSGSGRWPDHFFNKQTLRKKVNLAVTSTVVINFHHEV